MEKWFWFILTVIVSTVYLLLFRQFTIDHNYLWFLPIILLGAISFYGYYKLFSMGDVGSTYGILTGSIVVLVALGGILFFHESFTALKAIALAIIVLGVLLLSISSS